LPVYLQNNSWLLVLLILLSFGLQADGKASTGNCQPSPPNYIMIVAEGVKRRCIHGSDVKLKVKRFFLNIVLLVDSIKCLKSSERAGRSVNGTCIEWVDKASER
jgi:hypothetical protein